METLVQVYSLRGRKDPVTVLEGKGGIPFDLLKKQNLNPSGRTYLWEPLAKIISEIASNPSEHCSSRIILLDLSQSMTKHTHLLKRMWASIPTHGLQVKGLEIMIVTDGCDNQSEGEWRGNNGLFALVKHATNLGFECGIPVTNSIGTLHITLVNVGEKKLTFHNPLAARSLYGITITETRDPLVLSCIISQPRIDAHGFVDATKWPQISENTLNQIAERESLLTCEPKYDLDNLIESILQKGSLGHKMLAREAMFNILRTIIEENQKITVVRMGLNRELYHTEINSMLYSLAKHNIVVRHGKCWLSGSQKHLIIDQLR